MNIPRIIFAFAAFVAFVAVNTTAADAYYYRPAAPMFYGRGSLPDGCSPSDLYNGGNCGNQAASWCNTSVMQRRPLPPECFQRSVGIRGVYPGFPRYGYRHLVPLGSPRFYGVHIEGPFRCKRTYADGRVVWYPGRCNG